jgi:hypothetical protein
MNRGYNAPRSVWKMNIKSGPMIALLTLRTAALIVAAGFLAANARGYLLSRWGVSVGPTVYGIVAFVFIWIVYWLSTKRLLAILKARAVTRLIEIPAAARATESSDEQHTYKFPLRLVSLLGLLSATMMCVPIIVGASGDAVSLGGYLYCFVPACIPAIIAIKTLRYSVTTRSDRIVIRAGATREVPFTEIANVSVVPAKNGPQAIVLLTDGTKIGFSGMLTDFSDLMHTLMIKTRQSSAVGD